MKLIFTLHALDRIKKRKITKEEVEESIKFPDNTEKKHGLYYAQKKIQRGKIEIVYEKKENYIKVITLYWI